MRRLTNFKCNRCGSCCRVSPFLSNKDIEMIKKEGYTEDYFVEELRGQRFLKSKGDKCIFLEAKKGVSNCKVYESRPETCRKYPTEIRENGDCRPEVLRFDRKVY